MQVRIERRNSASPQSRPIEIVERKGIGHPDTMCDALAEGIVKLTQKIARLCSKERTIEGFGLSRAPVFSLFPPPQLSSRGRRLRAIFH